MLNTQWKEILDAVEKDDMISAVKKALKEKHKNIYEKWKECNFDINYDKFPFKIQDVYSSECTLLHILIYYNLVNSVQNLLNKGVNINAYDTDHNTPLHWAAQNNRTHIVRALLKKGAKVNIANIIEDTPLHLVARDGKANIVRILLKNGAKVNICGADRNTPLHLAVHNKYIDVVTVLLQQDKVDINATNTCKNTPLHRAILHGSHIEIIKALLRKGAKVNTANIIKDTPLHLAARKGDINIVEKLLENDADPLLKNDEKKTPRQSTYNNNITALLLKAEEKQKALLLKEEEKRKNLLLKAEKKQILKQRIVSITAGLSIAACEAAIVTLFIERRYIAVDPISITLTVLTIATTTLMAGTIAYQALEPSTKVKTRSLEMHDLRYPINIAR